MVTQMRGRQKNRRRHVRKILDISMTRFAGVFVLAGKVRLHSLTAIKECRDGRTAMMHVGIICTDHDDVANVYKYDRCRTFCGNILLRSELALSIQLSGHFGFPGDRCGTRGRKEYIATTTATDRIWGARDLRARGRRNSTSRGAMATGRQARLRAGEQHQTRCQRRLQRSVGGGRAERCGRYRVRRQFQRNHGKLIFEPLDRPGRAATVPGPPRKRVRARSVEKTQWMTRQSKNLEKHP
jgi:hypothetical protein